MKILREKIFGAIKRANKAKKTAWEIEQGRRIGSSSDSAHLAKINTRSANLADSVGAAEVRLIMNGEPVASTYVNRIQDSLSSKGKVPLHDKINTKAYMKGQGQSIKGFVDNSDYLTTDYFLSTGPLRTNNEISSRLEAARKGTTKQGRVKKSSYLKLKESQGSIEKRKEIVDKIRSNNKLKIAARDAKRWVKKNPGKTAAIGATVAAAGTGAVAYKHYKNRKDSKGE